MAAKPVFTATRDGCDDEPASRVVSVGRVPRMRTDVGSSFYSWGSAAIGHGIGESMTL
jgi:hypothetical protein